MEPTQLAVLANAIVAVLAAIMAYLGIKSYRATGNVKLLFIVIAFVVFIMKALFVSYNVTYHAVPHDAIEFVSALFDVVIVMLLFVPFFARAR